MNKRITALALGLMLLGALSNRSLGQTTPRTIEFAKLSDYVNDYNQRRDGERLIVTDVPPFGEELTYEKLNNIYFFSAGDPSDNGYEFYTSPTLAKSLRPHLKMGDYGSVRMYCTLVRIVSSQDVTRSAFVTRIEGFDGHGRLDWTVVGPQPVKLKLQG